MKLIINKITETSLFLFASALIAVVLPIYLHKWQTCLFGVFFSILAIIRLLQLYKIKKNESFFTVDVVCTSRKQDWLNIGVSKNCEFEPQSEEFDDIIELNIVEDEFFINRIKSKVREGYYYTIYFQEDKTGEKITDQAHYLGIVRKVSPTEKNKDTSKARHEMRTKEG